MRRVIIAFIASLFIASCVPATKFREVDKMKKECESERQALKIQNEKISVENNEGKRRLSLLETQNQGLLKDSVDRILKYNSLRSHILHFKITFVSRRDIMTLL